MQVGTQREASLLLLMLELGSRGSEEDIRQLTTSHGSLCCSNILLFCLCLGLDRTLHSQQELKLFLVAQSYAT